MPLKKKTGKGNQPITLRLPPDDEMLYRQRANAHGLSLSAFLTKTLINGVIAENVQEIEDRFNTLARSITESKSQTHATIPDHLLMSIYTSEYLLAEIVGSKSIQKVYEAQDRAKARVARERIQKSG